MNVMFLLPKGIKMKIEHIGFMVEDPIQVAKWYVEHLGFKIMRRFDNPPIHTHFLADSSRSLMIEIYNNPKVEVPDYASMDPLILHLAFSIEENMKTTKERLLDVGCSIVSDTVVTSSKDELTMLRDPWGFAIQLCKRKTPMI